MSVRKLLFALGFSIVTLVVVAGTPMPAEAAQTCDPSATTCFTTTTETVTVEQAVPGTTTNSETFETRVLVQGPDGTTFDRTVGAASDSSAVTDLTAEAKASATADGLQVADVQTTAPSRTLVDSAQTQVTTADREEVTTATETKFGPGTLNVGPDRSEVIVLLDGQTLFNTVTTTTRYVNVATNTTNTYLTTTTITIVGVAPAAPATTSTSTPAVSPGSTEASTGELARTGSSNGPWTAAGITLVLSGAVCLQLSRRTARRHTA